MYMGPLRAGDMWGSWRATAPEGAPGPASVWRLCAPGAGACLGGCLGATLVNSWETALSLVAWSAGALILLAGDGRRKQSTRP